jgi:hypothetical protein
LVSIKLTHVFGLSLQMPWLGLHDGAPPTHVPF